jgi:hypothetical protein
MVGIEGGNNMTYEDAVQKLNIVLGIENQHDRSLRDVYDDALLDLFTIALKLMILRSIINGVYYLTM